MQHRKNRHYTENPFKPYPYQENMITPELSGVAGLSVFANTDSSTRRQMFTTQQGQALDLIEADEPFLQTGLERKFGEATFAVRAPTDLRIIKIIPFYQKDTMFGGIRYNSVNYMIYEDVATAQIGIIELPEYTVHHPYFGFQYKQVKGVDIRRDQAIAKGQRILDTANVHEDGMYCTARNVNVAFMSHPSIAEDGFILSESVLEKYAFYTYEHRTVSFGSNDFALNIYGDDNHYKVCPDIGEAVRADGLLMALRSYDDSLAACEQSLLNTQIVDPISDERIWTDAGEGVVIDIKVLHDDAAQQPGLPVGMEKQLVKYHEGRKKFYREVLNTIKEVRRNSKGHIRVTPELQNLEVEAIAYLPSHDGKNKARLTYAQKPLDTWHVQFTIRRKRVPGIGGKLSDTDGGKGVVVKIIPDHLMPVDKQGRRAEMIIDGHSTNNRMNPGRLLEHFVNSFRQQVILEIREKFGYNPNKPATVEHVANWDHANHDEFEGVWNKLMRFYEIVSIEHHAAFKKFNDTTDRYEHIAYIINNDIHIFIPTNSKRETVDMVEMLEREFFRLNDSVTMGDMDGNIIEVKDAVSIASMYIMLLEKTGDDWSAVSSARSQVHGVLSQITKADKYRYTIRSQPTRSIGETELRLYTNYGGVEMGAELMDRNNNITSHMHAYRTLLEADKPTNIDRLIDRDDVPVTGGSAAKIFKSIIKCAGYGLRYTPYADENPNPALQKG